VIDTNPHTIELRALVSAKLRPVMDLVRIREKLLAFIRERCPSFPRDARSSSAVRQWDLFGRKDALLVWLGKAHN